MDKKQDEWKENQILKENYVDKTLNKETNHEEEYSIELTPTINKWLVEEELDTNIVGIDWWNFGVAYTGLLVVGLGIFIMPIYLGILGASIGYLAKMKGEDLISPWTISLGAASVVIGIFTSII